MALKILIQFSRSVIDIDLFHMAKDLLFLWPWVLSCGNSLPMWKILLLYYGLFDYHGLAVGGHLSIQDEMSTRDLSGIVLSDLKDCQLEEEQNEEKAQVLFLPQQCISDPWVCEWTTEGYEKRSSLQLTDPFDCGELGKVPWNDLPQQVELSFVSTNTCAVVWRTEDAVCHVSFPAGETMYAFVGGGPHFLGILDIDPAGCRWETTFLHCHRAVNMDEKALINMRVDRDRRFPRKKTHRIIAKIEDLPQEFECTWNTDVMQPQRLSEVVRNRYLCADPGEDLSHPIHVKYSYDGSCTMFLEYQTASCFLEVPKEKEDLHAFLYGESHMYPFLVGMLAKETDECIWEQNVMQC